MVCSTPNTRGLILRSLVFLSATAAALVSMPRMTSAQHTAGHTVAEPTHPVVIARGAYRPPASASRPVPVSRPARAIVPVPMARPVAPSRPARSTYPVRVTTPLPGLRVIEPTHVAGRNSFRAPRFVVPFFFTASIPESSGLAGSVSQFGGLPLGFGLWPACDSATTPGRFWTVGPCFGLGSYSAELTPAPAQTGPYIPPLTLFESAPPSGQAAAQPPSGPAPTTTRVLYFKDGTTIAATDWWVSLGRLQYITDSGQTGSVDVMQLDLERTNKENQSRGLDFRLKFTPPSDLYPPSIRP
ncbi:MAG TPA: hypothetical protein VN788_15075 [Verrucomicrobiae bacterium]|nr:hypothetical protein [Verrucomicrobiae bacterium]